MAAKYRQAAQTPAVLAAQERYFGRHARIAPAPDQDLLTAEEAEFIATRDSFYMGTTASDGWPYIQHRGGPAGFLKVLAPNLLGFADFKGNRQLLSTGNLDGDDRVSLFLMDYVRKERLKIRGHARVLDAREHRELADQLSPSAELRSSIERVFLIEVEGFDWNCPMFITPRYTADEVEEMMAPLKARIVELEELVEESLGVA